MESGASRNRIGGFPGTFRIPCLVCIGDADAQTGLSSIRAFEKLMSVSTERPRLSASSAAGPLTFGNGAV